MHITYVNGLDGVVGLMGYVGTMLGFKVPVVLVINLEAIISVGMVRN